MKKQRTHQSKSPPSSLQREAAIQMMATALSLVRRVKRQIYRAYPDACFLSKRDARDFRRRLVHLVFRVYTDGAIQKLSVDRHWIENSGLVALLARERDEVAS